MFSLRCSDPVAQPRRCTDDCLRSVFIELPNKSGGTDCEDHTKKINILLLINVTKILTRI